MLFAIAVVLALLGNGTHALNYGLSGRYKRGGNVALAGTSSGRLTGKAPNQSTPRVSYGLSARVRKIPRDLHTQKSSSTSIEEASDLKADDRTLFANLVVAPETFKQAADESSPQVAVITAADGSECPEDGCLLDWGDEEGTASAMPEEEMAIAAVEESAEAILRLTVQQETVLRQQRSAELLQLERDIASTMARKRENEGLVARQLSALLPRVMQAKEDEAQRVQELIGIVASIRAIETSKQAEYQAGAAVLQEMQAVRDKVQEAAISAQLDAALAKKVQLCELDCDMLGLIQDCLQDLESEIIVANVKLASLSRVMDLVDAADPADPAASARGYRSYSWGHIEELQALLTATLEGARASGNKVKAILGKIDQAGRQRGGVLGLDVRQTPAAGQRGQAAAEAKVSTDYSLVKLKSTEQLVDLGAGALLKTALSLGTTTATLLTSVATWVKSDSATQTSEAAAQSWAALREAGKQSSATWAVAVDTWEQATSPDPSAVPTLGSFLSGLRRGIAVVTEDAKVREAVQGTWSSTQRSASQASIAYSTLVQGLSGSLDKDFGKSVGGIKDGLSTLGAVAKVAVSRISADAPSTGKAREE